MYASFAVAGFIFGAVVFVFLLKLRGVSLRLPLFAGVISCIGLLCGARLFGYAAAQIYFVNSGRQIQPGLVFYGGLAGFLLVYVFAQRAAFGEISHVMCDCAAVFVPAFHLFGRVGCYLAPCCGGEFFGLPVQLVESGFNLSLFLVLLLLFVKQKAYGRLLQVYLSCYGVFRFFIEFYRTDKARGMIGLLSFSQWISLAVLVACLAYQYKKIREFCRKRV